jgi:hypothetical protein
MNPTSATTSARRSHSHGFPIEGSAAAAAATFAETPPVTVPERSGVLELTDAALTGLLVERTAVRTGAFRDDVLAALLPAVTAVTRALVDGVAGLRVVVVAAICGSCPFDESVPVTSEACTEENVHKNRTAAIRAIWGMGVLVCVIIVR